MLFPKDNYYVTAFSYFGSISIVGVGFFESYSITVFRAVLIFIFILRVFWSWKRILLSIIFISIRTMYNFSVKPFEDSGMTDFSATFRFSKPLLVF